MEMYCVFVSNQKLPLSRIEKCEQDLKVCRKVVIVDAEQIEARLSFLRPLEEVLAAPLDVNQLFWSETAKFLNKDEVAFLKKAQETSISLEELLRLMPRNQ
jgi:hypothetical protein